MQYEVNGIQSIAVLGSIARPQGRPFLTFILSLAVTHVLIATNVRIAERVDIPGDCYLHMLQSRRGHQKVNLARCEHFTFLFTRIPQLQLAPLTNIQPRLCKKSFLVPLEAFMPFILNRPSLTVSRERMEDFISQFVSVIVLRFSYLYQF